MSAHLDILPESRMKRTVGSIRGPGGSTLIPIYCANCGKPHGMVPDTMITFAFALCQACAESGLGDLAHFYMEPDEVFWERIETAMGQEQKRIGKPIDEHELRVQLDDPTSTLAKLAEEWRAHAIR